MESVLWTSAVRAKRITPLVPLSSLWTTKSLVPSISWRIECRSPGEPARSGMDAIPPGLQTATIPSLSESDPDACWDRRSRSPLPFRRIRIWTQPLFHCRIISART